jgi:lactoylglutathione lyase
MSLHFHHCHIQIRSIEESLEFFCEQMGLIELNRNVIESAGLTLLYLAAPDDMSQGNRAAILELAYYHDERPISDGSRFAHIAFSVENLIGYCQQMERKGVKILQAPVDQQYAYIQAPDGLLVELIQS